MKYIEEDLPDKFSCINSAGTHIFLTRENKDSFMLSSLTYEESYLYSIRSILNYLNNKTWYDFKIINVKEFNYDIY